MFQKTKFSIKEIGIIRFCIGLLGALLICIFVIRINKLIIFEDFLPIQYNFDRQSYKLLLFKFIYYFGVASWSSGLAILFWGEKLPKIKRAKFYIASHKSRTLLILLIYLYYVLNSTPELYLLDSNVISKVQLTQNLIFILVPLFIFSNNWNEWRRLYDCRLFYLGNFVLAIVIGIIGTLLYLF